MHTEETEDEGYNLEPDADNDAIVSTNGYTFSVSYCGKHLGTFSEIDAAEEAIRDAQHDSNYWPSVWYISDHGNAMLGEHFDWLDIPHFPIELSDSDGHEQEDDDEGNPYWFANVVVYAVNPRHAQIDQTIQGSSWENTDGNQGSAYTVLMVGGQGEYTEEAHTAALDTLFDSLKAEGYLPTRIL